MTLPFSISSAQAKTLAGGAAAVCAFLLTQSDVVIPPPVKLALGCVVVFLAALGIQGSDNKAE